MAARLWRSPDRGRADRAPPPQRQHDDDDFEQLDEEEVEDYDAAPETPGGGADRDGGGTRDNLPIPIFDGSGSRDFSRRVEAWQLATSLRSERRGPALYARLQDDAWTAVEDIDMQRLAEPGGLEFLMLELKDRFEEQEILRQGDVLHEFFVLLKRRPQEQIRTFKRRFNTLVHRLAKFAVTLPAIVLGWFFLEKLRLPSDRRAMVLASANVDYDFKVMSAAAERNCPNVAEFDRPGGRGRDQPFKPKVFQRFAPRGGRHRAMHAEPEDDEVQDPVQDYLHDLDEDEYQAVESFLANGGDPTDLPGLDEFEDDADDQEPGDDQEETMAALAEAYVAGFRESNKRFQQKDMLRMKFTSAKFKMKDFKNQRGCPPPPAPHQVQRDPKRQKEVDDLKKNFVCKACDQRGRWKGDPERPKTRGGGQPSSGARRPMLAIHDSGCAEAEPHRVMTATSSRATATARSTPKPAAERKPNTSAGFYSSLAHSFPVFIFASFEELRRRVGFAYYDSGCTRCVMGYNMLKLWAALLRPAAKQLGIRDDPRTSTFSFPEELGVPPVPIQKRPDLRRAWWRFAQILMNAAQALMTPMRGVMISMGHRKRIISRVTHVRPTRKGITQMTKAELRAELLTIGVDTSGSETCAALRGSLRAVRPPEEARHQNGTPRAKLASGFSKLRKPEAIAFCQAAGVAIDGAADALKLRIKAWAAAEGPIPSSAVSAKSLLGSATPSRRSVQSSSAGPPPEATPSTPPMAREIQAKVKKRGPPSTSSHMSLDTKEDHLARIRTAPTRTAATTAVRAVEVDWDPDQDLTRVKRPLRRGMSVLSGLRGALASWALPAMCLAATIGESAGLNLASCAKTAGEHATKEVRVAVDEDGAKINFVEIWGGKAAASREAARRGFRVGQPLGCLVLEPTCRIWSHMQNLVFKGDKQRLRRARLKELPTLKLVEKLFGMPYEDGRMAALEHPWLGQSWNEGPWKRRRQLPGMVEFQTDMCAHGLTCPQTGKAAKKPTRILATHAPFEKHCGLRQVYTKDFSRRIVDAFEEVLNQSYQAMAADVDDEGDEAPEEEPMGSRAISFGEKAGILPLEVRSHLRRLHQNLGHPLKDDLARNLRLNGADDALVRGAKHLRCATCNRTKPSAGSHRVSRLSPVGGFNDELGVDGLYLRNASTTYHVARYLKSRKPATVAKVFRELWPAGPPSVVRLDLDGMFYTEFQEAMDMMGIRVRAVAGQAQWQNGRTERHGGWLKLMVNRVVEHKSVTSRGDLETAVWETCQAKNDMRRICGFSPSQWMYGCLPTTSADLIDRPGQIAEHSMHRVSTELARRMAIRTAARTAFVELQNSQALRRALLRKPRVTRINYQNGDLAFYWRLRKGTELHEWRGPAVVIGPAGASNFWLSHGAGTVQVSHEQLRPAEDEEIWWPGQGDDPNIEELNELIRQVEKEDQPEYEDDRGRGPREADEKAQPLQRREGQDLGDTLEERAKELEQEIEEIERGKRPADAAERLEDEPPRKRQEAAAPSGPAPSARAGPPASTATPPQPALPEQGVPYTKEEFKKRRAALQARQSQVFRPFPVGPLQHPGDHPEQPVHFANFSFGLIAKRSWNTTRLQRRALEKEMPWNMIPTSDRPLYRQAAELQWKQWENYDAVEPLSVEESRKVRERVHQSRILTSRFLYRNENAGVKDAPPKPKARLCCGGHSDLDFTMGPRTDAPTVSRHSVLTFLAVAAACDFDIVAGDIECAFLQGEEHGRAEELYMSQPKEGLPNMDPRCLLKVKKGIFGLADAPRLWWRRLRRGLVEADLKDEDVKPILMMQSRLDPTVFRGFKEDDRLCILVCVHADDLLVATKSQALRQGVRGLFNFGEWRHVPSTFIEGRLEPIEIDKARKRDPSLECNAREVADNRSAVGSLGWPARETRPDLSCTVSMAQRKQNAPCIQDLLDVNKAIGVLQSSASEKFHIPKLDVESPWCLIVYHDAAWGNALTEDEALRRIAQGEMVHSQAGYLVYLCERAVAEGRPGKAILVDWRSHTLPRVARSTFAAETQSCTEAFDSAEFVRAVILEMMHADLDVTSREMLANIRMLPITRATDCKSLYDTLRRDAGKLPQEKRLIMDLAWLREAMQLEAAVDPRESMNVADVPMRWVPTAYMLADLLTKTMDLTGQFCRLVSGSLRIPRNLPGPDEGQ
ncbi:unnamed protein product [Prorocentrum cordatum]|uniref:Integrase catalytic domain-containing protein n=1 Tax=Prorocentrum cordatum TaxID=2364126 RepID=A0ABN9T0R2_9DINO|nr:unnamed protein product [Polarella glacialis]